MCKELHADTYTENERLWGGYGKEYSPILPDREVVRRICAHCGQPMILFKHDEDGNVKNRYPRFHNGHCSSVAADQRLLKKVRK